MIGIGRDFQGDEKITAPVVSAVILNCSINGNLCVASIPYLTTHQYFTFLQLLNNDG